VADPSSPVRVGVVGGGLIAQLVHLPLLASMPHACRAVALCDPSRTVRETLGRRWELASVHATHDEMLAVCELDALIICSPNETHAAVALDAIAVGCAVLVEKPLALAPADAEGVVAAARERGVVARVAYMKQHDPAFATFAQVLPDGEPLLHVEAATVDNAIGQRFRPRDLVHAADVPVTVRNAAEAALRAQAADALGPEGAASAVPYSLAFAGALVHDVNLVLTALAALDIRPAEVIDAAGAPDATSASLYAALSNGARWSASWLLAPRAPRFTEVIRFTFADGPRTLVLPAPYADVRRGYEPQLRCFTAAVAAGGDTDTTLEQGARDVAFLAAAHRRLLERQEAVAA
jgi:predicted dehydrogenase